MADLSPVLPGTAVPDLSVPLVGGGTFSIRESAGDPFTMVVVYRGLHCPICKGYLGKLHALLPQFRDKGVEVIAVSADPQDRATQAKDEWGLPNLAIGHSLGLAEGRRWGLFLSQGRGMTSAGMEETRTFFEPAVFLVRPDGTLYYEAVQSMPFARPSFDDLLSAIAFVTEKNYPPRGDLAAVPAQAAAE